MHGIRKNQAVAAYAQPPVTGKLSFQRLDVTVGEVLHCFYKALPRFRNEGSDELLGLRVDDVLTVLEVPAGSVHEAPRGLHRGLNPSAGWVSSLIDCEASSPDGRSKVMLQVLSPERLLADLGVDSGAQALAAAPSAARASSPVLN